MDGSSRCRGSRTTRRLPGWGAAAATIVTAPVCAIAHRRLPGQTFVFSVPAGSAGSAASSRAALQRRGAFAGRCIGLALTGGNVDREVFARVLAQA